VTPGLRVEVRFYAELNDFLPIDRRGRPFSVEVASGTTVKDLVESLGVPHTEVEVILVEGRSVGFSHQVSDQDHVSVYPVFESLDVSPLLRLRPEPLRHPRFVVDVHLGGLARHLRLLGFDTTWHKDASDEELTDTSVSERRILLTKDTGLLKRRAISHGHYVRGTSAVAQAVEVLRRFDLFDATAPFTRCLECNSALELARKEDLAGRVPRRVAAEHDAFRLCPGCGRVYWPGSHYRHLAGVVETIRSQRTQAPDL
jgi:uncharacterized protein